MTPQQRTEFEALAREARALADAATQEDATTDYHVYDYCPTEVFARGPKYEGVHSGFPIPDDHPQAEADAIFFTHARTSVLALCNALEACLAEIDRMRPVVNAAEELLADKERAEAAGAEIFYPDSWDALRQALEEEGGGWEAKCVRFVERFIGEIGKGEWWFHDEWSTEVMPIAAECGIAEYVPYDPAVHGEWVEAEPGDEIWVWVTPPSDSVAAEACSKCGKPSTWTESTQLEESGVPLCDECAGVIYMTAEAQAEGGGA